MPHFSKEYLDFFKKLATNNNKDWFDANRSDYEKFVKKPFEDFTTDLIKAVGKVDKDIKISHKEAIFRINRDVRFSKDKSPYKLNRSAVISKMGKNDKSYPGIYLEAGADHFRVYGGCYEPDKDQLSNIRFAMSENPAKIQKLINAPDFKKIFGEVRGVRNKIVPKEFKPAAEKFPLIANKQFYWFTELPATAILKNDIIEKSVAAFKAGKGLQDYFISAIR